MSEVKFIVCNYFCLLATVRRRHHSTINHVPCSANIRKYLNVPIEHFFALCKVFSLSKARFLLVHNIEHLTSPARLFQLPLPLLKLVSGEICYVLTSTFISINLQTRLNLLQKLLPLRSGEVAGEVKM